LYIDIANLARGIQADTQQNRPSFAESFGDGWIDGIGAMQIVGVDLGRGDG
jgi:hypothetical protein